MEALIKHYTNPSLHFTTANILACKATYSYKWWSSFIVSIVIDVVSENVWQYSIVKEYQDIPKYHCIAINIHFCQH